MAGRWTDFDHGPWDVLAPGPDHTGKPRPLVGMLVFPGMTMLDLVGPHTTLAGPTQTVLIGKSTEPFRTDTGFETRANIAFADAPADLDILFVPGGPGQVDVMADHDYLDFLADRGSRARYVTSVCTGSLILGAAGLLQGYRATSHWAALPLLPVFGAEAVAERVVRDRNRLTGGGVTAGIDFGLTLLHELFDETTPRLVQLLMEYDPAPPFDAGSPDRAGDDLVDQAMVIMGGTAGKTVAAIERLLEHKPRFAALADVD